MPLRQAVQVASQRITLVAEQPGHLLADSTGQASTTGFTRATRLLARTATFDHEGGLS